MQANTVEIATGEAIRCRPEEGSKNRVASRYMNCMHARIAVSHKQLLHSSYSVVEFMDSSAHCVESVKE